MKNEIIPEKKVSFDQLLAHLTEQGYSNASQIGEILTQFKNAVTLKVEDTALFKKDTVGRSELYEQNIESVAKAIYAVQNSILKAAGKVTNMKLLVRPTIMANKSDLELSLVRIRCEKYDLVMQYTKEITYRFGGMDGEWEHSVEISILSHYQGMATYTAKLYLFTPVGCEPVEAAVA